MRMRDMTTKHLVNSLAMLLRHGVQYDRPYSPGGRLLLGLRNEVKRRKRKMTKEQRDALAVKLLAKSGYVCANLDLRGVL